jgi:hypothetical protein
MKTSLKHHLFGQIFTSFRWLVTLLWVAKAGLTPAQRNLSLLKALFECMFPPQWLKFKGLTRPIVVTMAIHWNSLTFCFYYAVLMWATGVRIVDYDVCLLLCDLEWIINSLGFNSFVYKIQKHSNNNNNNNNSLLLILESCHTTCK